MRVFMVALLSVVCVAAASPMAAATPSALGKSMAAPALTVVPVANRCPQGQHWVPAGYAKHGKYRVGHCSPN